MTLSDKAWVRGRVAEIHDLTPTIREFTIALDRSLPAPAGAHVKVQVQGRVDTRCYSVVSADAGTLRIAVKLHPASRGGSAYMWSLKLDASIRLTPPRCDFPLTPGAPHYLLIAAGVGVTPLVAMADQLARSNAVVRMLYLARSAAEFAYAKELRVILGDRLVMLDTEVDDRPDLLQEIALLPVDAELYMCGPLRLMEAVRSVWLRAGRSLARLRYETFGSGGNRPAEQFMIKVPRLGKAIEVAENQSMLDALEAAGVEVVFECRRGECGLCAVDILETEGTIDHRDIFFSERQHTENRKICACVSRVTGGSVTIDPAWRGDGAFLGA
ncbi:PDR/VanB family oxidoreductase [Sphingomonas bisphenolicum]|uniref:Diguanylate cyclase n=1 Tax=Sphingomonas bisphenolicum TaxID=296544 RepID=A0ABN5WQR1_9SPHN|nr:PDR/VanB family oxidoreductase [Sphingomonas bisphenolicum]BBF72016.1 diguanylate cyclase [Sphingomonas bisphenolicum]